MKKTNSEISTPRTGARRDGASARRTEAPREHVLPLSLSDVRGDSQEQVVVWLVLAREAATPQEGQVEMLKKRITIRPESDSEGRCRGWLVVDVDGRVIKRTVTRAGARATAARLNQLRCGSLKNRKTPSRSCERCWSDAALQSAYGGSHSAVYHRLLARCPAAS